MTPSPIRRRRSMLRFRPAFWRDRRAMAAVEFAMILPLMVMLYIGAIDVTRGVMASRKVAQVSRTIADLVSQQPTTSTASTTTLATIFTAASAIMQPYSTGNITMTVSAVTIKAQTSGLCCDATVNWSYTQSGTLRPCSVKLTQVSPGTAPAATNVQKNLITANQQAGYVYALSNGTYLIVADVTYAYQPLFSQAMPWFSTAFQKTSYMVPRSATGQISLASATSAGAGQSGVICP